MLLKLNSLKTENNHMSSIKVDLSYFRIKGKSVCRSVFLVMRFLSRL